MVHTRRSLRWIMLKSFTEICKNEHLLIRFGLVNILLHSKEEQKIKSVTSNKSQVKAVFFFRLFFQLFFISSRHKEFLLLRVKNWYVYTISITQFAVKSCWRLRKMENTKDIFWGLLSSNLSLYFNLNSRKKGMLLESNQAEKLLTHSNWIQNSQRLQERSHHV